MKPFWVGRKLSWLWVVGAVIGLLVVVALYCALFAHDSFPAVLSLLDVILSWPVAAAIVGVAFAQVFEPELRQYLRYLTIRLPGGTQITAQAPPASETDAISETLEEASVGSSDTATDGPAFDLAIAFHYLDTFLVATTQAILQWIASADDRGVSLQDYAGFAAGLTTDPAQPAVILAVVQATLLVKQEDGRLVLTDLGRRYLDHRKTFFG